MAKKNRQTLKNYFKPGERPTYDAFSDLIDSSVNILDDDFSNVQDTALKVTGNNERRSAISIFSQPDDREPIWNIDISKEGDLMFSNGEGKNKLILSSDGNVKLNSKTIYLNGENVVQGMGGKCEADGKWHFLSSDFSHINMFEINAIYISTKNRSTTLLNAFASHCNGRKRIIRKIKPFTFFWQNKLKMKWIKVKNRKEGTVIYKLAIRSKFSNKDAKIHYRIRQIWQG